MSRIPLVILIAFVLALSIGLLSKHEAKPPIPVQQTIETFTLPVLGDSHVQFTPDLWKNRITIINVFASWCPECQAEHPTIMRLAKKTRVKIIGIAWKDTPKKIAAWLKTHGNPYNVVAVDQQGDATLPLSLSGVPETILIDEHGRVAWHNPGPLTDEMVDNRILPLIDKMRYDEPDAH